MTDELERLREEARRCQACDLHRNATQTVFGAGPSNAEVVLVGEQPGHEEDLAGQPFVGPAGRLLDRALAEAGIDRARVFVTNAVKHFKFESKGKRRLHRKPSSRELAACRPWLDREIAAIAPRVIVCMGASAAQQLLGRDFRVTKRRGELIEWRDGIVILATVHPSSILRAPDDETRRAERARFVEDLRLLTRALERPRGAA